LLPSDQRVIEDVLRGNIDHREKLPLEQLYAIGVIGGKGGILPNAIKPSVVQRFFASKWPLRMWFVSTAGAAMVCSLAATDFSVRLLVDWKMAALYLLIIVIAAPLGFMLGVCPGFMIIAPIFHVRMLINGGPFKVGDTVQIIGGSHDAMITKIYSGWQGAQVRVEMGEAEKDSYQDVLSPTQILLVQRSKPDAPPEGLHRGVVRSR
jgi:hypothetical protein